MKNAGMTLPGGLCILIFMSFTWYIESNSNVANEGSKVQWMSFEEAVAKNQEQPRKIMIDLYTEWCGWCKRMDHDTFEDEDIANYLNAYYYSVKFDAEYKEDIVFKGRTYKYINNGRRGYHELAAELANGRMSFPTTVFFDEKLQKIQPIPGYKKPVLFQQIITYFGQDMHKKMPWEKYQQAFPANSNDRKAINTTPVSH